MLNTTVLEIGAEKAIMLGGFLIQIALVWLAIIKFRQVTQDKIDKKIESVSSDLKVKINDVKLDNEKDHEKMNLDISLVEKRGNKMHDDLKADFVRDVSEIKTTMGKMLTILLEMKSKK